MRLAEARKQARYSQQQVADLKGCSRPTIARMEKHPEDVTIEDAIWFSRLYDVPFSELFFVPLDCSKTDSQEGA